MLANPSSSSRRTKVLLTGGAGYVGSILIPRLRADGYEVRVLDNLMYSANGLFAHFMDPGFEFVRGSVTDRDRLGDCLKDVDLVIHLAAIVGFPACKRSPELARAVNTESSRMLAEMTPRNVPIIYSSTCSVYGENSNGLCTEETPVHPLTLYAETKAQAEEYIMERGNSVIFRFATAFGMSPRIRLDLLINGFVHQAIWRKFLIVYEKGFRRGFIHVRDLADAIVFAVDHLDRMAGGVYNAGSPELNLTKEELAVRIKEKRDYYLHFAEIGTDEDQRNYSMSYGKLEALGYAPKIGLDQGLDELIKGLSTIEVTEPFANG